MESIKSVSLYAATIPSWQQILGAVDGLQGGIQCVGDPIFAHRCESASQAKDPDPPDGP